MNRNRPSPEPLIPAGNLPTPGREGLNGGNVGDPAFGVGVAGGSVGGAADGDTSGDTRPVCVPMIGERREFWGHLDAEGMA